MCLDKKACKSTKKCSKKSKSSVCGKGTRAQNRQKLRIEKIVQQRDAVSNWLDKLLKDHIENLDRLSKLEKHLILMEENALQQLVTALNARVRFAEVQSRDLNGEVLHETPALELDFIRGPRYFAKRKPVLLNIKKGK